MQNDKNACPRGAAAHDTRRNSQAAGRADEKAEAVACSEASRPEGAWPHHLDGAGEQAPPRLVSECALVLAMKTPYYHQPGCSRADEPEMQL
jgi:hypothetical protein